MVVASFPILCRLDGTKCISDLSSSSNLRVSKKLDSLGFRRAIVEVYSKKYTKDSSGLFKHPQMCQNNEVRYDNVGHWIKKATQRRCQNKPCKGTTLYCCEKCTVALDPECFKAYHTCWTIQASSNLHDI